MFLKLSTARTLTMGPFVDATDAVTPETALGLVQGDVRRSKNGGAYAQKNDATAPAHQENGHYSVVLNATDTDTLGHLRIAIYKTGALPVWADFLVLPAQVYDSLVAGTDLLDTDHPATQANALADAVLNRDMSAVSDTNARSPLNALRKLMNKWSISGSVLTVTKENDSTTAFTQNVVATPGADPITSLDTV